MDSGVSASQKYAPEIHSVMTGTLREKVPHLASHIRLPKRNYSNSMTRTS